MSSGGKKEEEVILLRYDISHGMGSTMYGPMLGMKLEAIWHTAVLVFGHEYLFDGGGGIMRAIPRSTPFGEPLREESLGTTTKTLQEFEEWNEEMRRVRFGGNSYELLNNNCNHYTNEAAFFLTGKGGPDDVVNLIPNMIKSPLGSMLSPLLTPLVQGMMNVAAQQEQPSAMNFPHQIPETDERARPNTEGNFGPEVTGAGIGEWAAQFLNTDPERDEDDGGIAADQEERRAREQESGGRKKKKGATSTTIEEIDEDEAPVSPSSNMNHHRAASKPAEDGVEDITLPSGTTSCTPPATSATRHVDPCSATQRAQEPEDVEDVVISSLHGDASARPSNASTESDLGPLEEFVKLYAAVEEKNEKTPEPLRLALKSFCAIARTCASGATPETPIHLNHHPIGRISAEGKGYRWLELLGYHLSADKLTASYHAAYRTQSSQIQALYNRACDELEELETKILIQQTLEEESKVQQQQPSTTTTAGSPTTVSSSSGGGGTTYKAATPSTHQQTSEKKKAQVSSVEPAATYQKDFGLTSLSSSMVVPSSKALLERRQKNNESNVDRFGGEAPLQLGPDQQVTPLQSLDQLLAWDGHTIDKVVANCPSSSSSSLRNSRWAKKTASNSPRVAVIHDYRGGNYNEDSVLGDGLVHGVGGSGCYSPKFLDTADLFVYFSHNFISPPPLQWTRLLHRNGIPALGTLYTDDNVPRMLSEGGEGNNESGHATFWRDVLPFPTLRKELAFKLAQLAKILGFDGWMIDIQNSTGLSSGVSSERETSGLYQDLIQFIQEVKEAGASSGSSSSSLIVAVYDTVISSGSIKSQGRINHKNSELAAVADAYFGHYGAYWSSSSTNEPSGTTSEYEAANKEKLFGTIDCFGRHESHLAQEFTAQTVAMAVRQNGHSVALFAPGWTSENQANNQPQEVQDQKDSEWWSAIATALNADGSKGQDQEPTCTVIRNLPYLTTFNSGYYPSSSAASKDSQAKAFIQGKPQSVQNLRRIGTTARLQQQQKDREGTSSSSAAFQLEQVDAPRFHCTGHGTATIVNSKAFNGSGCLQVTCFGGNTEVTLATLNLDKDSSSSTGGAASNSHIKRGGRKYLVLQVNHSTAATLNSSFHIGTADGSIVFSGGGSNNNISGAIKPCFQNSVGGGENSGWNTQRFAFEISSKVSSVRELSTLKWKLAGNAGSTGEATAFLGQLILTTVEVGDTGTLSPLSFMCNTSPLTKPFLAFSDPTTTFLGGGGSSSVSLSQLGQGEAGEDMVGYNVTINTALSSSSALVACGDGESRLGYYHLFIDGRYVGRSYTGDFTWMSPPKPAGSSVTVGVQAVDSRGIHGSVVETQFTTI